MNSERAIAIAGGNTPLYNAIKAYADSGTVPFHMPGHKLGAGMPPEFLSGILGLDLTELPGTDNLHHPAGAIRAAQELAAEAFGALASYFLVNGSTGGILAMIPAICRPGDSLIVGRDCHRAVIGGMLLAGVRPVYVLPEYDAHFGITTGITPESVEAALCAEPDAAGVLLTRPNYYGVCNDLADIARIVHSHGKLLAVDEAHGAHLRFTSRLPISALEAGADICVQSAHKTLPALTQGAYLHVGSEAIDRERLQYFLRTFQTSSPSYLIMASLDIARAIMQEAGEKGLNSLLSQIGDLKEKNRVTANRILCKNHLRGFDLDETRITLCVKELGMSGYEAEELLRTRFGIQVEMSDLYNIVCIAVPADLDQNLGRLFSALGRLPSLSRSDGASREHEPYRLQLPVQKLGLAEAVRARSSWVRLEEAAGRISKEIVAPYPPGIPVLCPGEEISREAADYLRKVAASGGLVHGLNEKCELNVI